ncbi:Protein N-acetyltransferase, RimJ/RimL family [Hathewaya proteolytica DSM 3090]|uniref:Protein N-acetyltransferase, RimJ/RimL family n=1 Tax=Hathewaya proteolytica DSM 3090 TaxID=1121331 RepID=A0A1M6R9Q5_9CLOT|nr:GNAT family protein [Hathewaya proteolytica]SHK29194.1 Protein N-acetyltransferase, RimJ/RimL family [Hathewaya proteolytica DSM 3090]
MVPIETERLLLREWHENDLQDLLELLQDERVAKCSGGRTILDVDDCRNSLHCFMKSGLSWAISLHSSDKVIGFIGIDNISLDKNHDHLNSCYIGYTINTDYWNKGFATEATKALIKHLLEIEQRDEIWTSHYNFNSQSKRVIEKCGFIYRFSKEKSLKTLDGKIVQELCYSITKQN